MSAQPAVLTVSDFDTRYQWKTILLLSLSFGLVGLDRWIIAPLFPAMMLDLHLTYQDLGNVVGGLAIIWGVAAGWMGRVSDRVGRRKVVIPALVGFSLISGATGLATGAASLLVLRALVGASEGAYFPASLAAVNEATPPRWRGACQGLVFCTFPLFGLGIGPILATRLLDFVPSWRWVFFIVMLPGLVLAGALFLVLRDPQRPCASMEVGTWKVVTKSRNVPLAMLAMVGGMSSIFVLSAMVPSYLVSYLKVSPHDMGIIMSALGLGGFAGNLCLPTISDYVGRRVALISSALLATCALWLFIRTGPQLWTLYTILFVVSMFCFGVLAMANGPIASEAVPPALTSSSVGLVSGVGEIFGGGLAPIIAGFVATHFGIQNVFLIGISGLLSCVIVGLLLHETAPRLRQPPRSTSKA